MELNKYFFEALRMRLENILRALSNNRKAHIVYNNCMATDVKNTVYLQARDYIEPNVKPSLAELLLFYKARVSHEGAHLRFTSLDDWKEACSRGPIFQHLTNIIEDGRIEAAISQILPGAGRWIKFTNQYNYKHRKPEAYGTGLDAFLMGLNVYSILQTIPPFLETQRLIKLAAPYVDIGRAASATKEVLNCVEKILAIPEIKSLIDASTPPPMIEGDKGTTSSEKTTPSDEISERAEKAKKIIQRRHKNSNESDNNKDDENGKKNNSQDTESTKDTSDTEAPEDTSDKTDSEEPSENLNKEEVSQDSQQKNDSQEDVLNNDDEQKASSNEETSGNPDEEDENTPVPEETLENLDEDIEDEASERLDEDNEDASETLENQNNDSDDQDFDEEESNDDINEDEEMDSISNDDSDGILEDQSDNDLSDDDFDAEDFDDDLSAGLDSSAKNHSFENAESDDFASENLDSENHGNPGNSGDDEEEFFTNPSEEDFEELLEDTDKEVLSLSKEAESLEEDEKPLDVLEGIPVNIHSGVSLIVRELPKATRYQQLKKQNEVLIKNLVNEIKVALETRKAYDLRSLNRGKLHSGSLWKLAVPDPAVFSRRVIPGDIPELAVHILVDLSGSMDTKNTGGNITRIESVQNAACVLSETMRQLRIVHAVTGFQGAYPRTYHYPAVTWDDTESDKIASFSANNSNRDGYSIRIAANELSYRQEPKKILFVLSDGQPADGHYPPSIAHNDVKQAVFETKNKGIKLISLFFGDEYIVPYFKLMYDTPVFVPNLTILPRALGEVFKKIYLE